MPNPDRQAAEGDETNVGNVNLATAAAGSTSGTRKATSEGRASADGSRKAAAASSSAGGTESRLGFAILSQASDKLFRLRVRGGSACLSNIDKSTH